MSSGLSPVSHLEFSFRVAVALLLGSCIGVERQWRQRNAGLRTNALVATGTALFIQITPLLDAQGNVYQIASYVVSGIGFLAGGVIFKERLSVSGLNTAATLWCTAAVGELTGFGYILEACIGVAAILIANVALRPIARRINQQPFDESEVLSSYKIRAICRNDVEETVRSVLVAAFRANSLHLSAMYAEAVDDEFRMELVADVTVSGRPEVRLESVVSQIASKPGVTAVSWKLVPTDHEQALITET